MREYTCLIGGRAICRLGRKTAQLLHMGVAQHYQVPVISYGEAVLPEFFRQARRPAPSLHVPRIKCQHVQVLCDLESDESHSSTEIGMTESCLVRGISF